MGLVLEVRLIGSLYGSTWINVHHFEDTAQSASQLQDLSTTFAADWVSIIRTVGIRELLFTRLEVRDATNNNLVPLISDLGVTGAQSGSDEVHPSIAYVIRKKTAFTGRANRGRFFWPSVFNGDFKFGLIGPAGIARWQPVLQQLENIWCEPTAGRFILVVRHPEGFTRVEQLVLSERLGHMRSRKVGIGI